MNKLETERVEKDTILQGLTEDIRKTAYEDEVFVSKFLYGVWGWQFDEFGAHLGENYRTPIDLMISLDGVDITKISHITVVGCQESSGGKAGVSKPVVVKLNNKNDENTDGKYVILLKAHTAWSSFIHIRGAFIELKNR